MSTSRRQLLTIGLAAAGGAVVGGTATGLVVADRLRPKKAPPPEFLTFEHWAANRKAPYYIGHRGAGTVCPEHTIPSYTKAIEWGAQCIEISVVLSSDGVAFCHHDLTLDRTTTLTGAASKYTAAELDRGRVNIPRLGPKWVGDNMPPIPRLKDALAAVRGRAVVCVEPKNDAAFPVILMALEEAGMTGSAMIKLDATSERISEARDKGYPLFVYLGNPERATKEAIREVGNKLEDGKDALVLPARVSWHEPMAQDIVRAAVDTGASVWLFPVHRRSEAAYFSRLGVEGMVTPDVGYLSGTVAKQITDDWPSGAIAPGEITVDPYSTALAIDWSEDSVIGLGFKDRQSWLCLGQFSPITADSYRITFDATFSQRPTDTWQGLSIAFGHATDAYYEHRGGFGDGYHAMLRADGTLGLFTHLESKVDGIELQQKSGTSVWGQGQWTRMTLDVTPDLIRWSRDDGSSVEARDDRFRGGYLHIGSTALDGMLRVRNLEVA